MGLPHYGNFSNALDAIEQLFLDAGIKAIEGTNQVLFLFIPYLLLCTSLAYRALFQLTCLYFNIYPDSPWRRGEGVCYLPKMESIHSCTSKWCRRIIRSAPRPPATTSPVSSILMMRRLLGAGQNMPSLVSYFQNANVLPYSATSLFCNPWNICP